MVFLAVAFINNIRICASYKSKFRTNMRSFVSPHIQKLNIARISHTRANAQNQSGRTSAAAIQSKDKNVKSTEKLNLQPPKVQ